MLAIRAQLGITPRPVDPEPPPAPHDVDPPVLSWAVRNAQAELERRRRVKSAGPAADPEPPRIIRPRVAEYLAGRESAPPDSGLYNAPSAAQRPDDGRLYGPPPQNGPQSEKTAAGIMPARVRVYPGLTALAHKRSRDPECRVYHVAKAIDLAGVGRVTLAELRAQLAGVHSDRRVRQIIAAGAGVFWDRTEDQIYLYSPYRVIDGLGGGRMAEAPVMIAAADLLGGIARYRAVAVFGAFLSGRRRSENPISQSAIREAVGVAESTQRTYYKAAGVRARRGIKLIGAATAARSEEAFWQHGRAVFRFVDWLGKHGTPRAEYLAQSIGNIYGVLGAEKAAAGRSRKINQQLPSSDIRGRGNDSRVYFQDGGSAWRAYSRRNSDRAYYSGDRLVPDMARPVRLSGVAVYIAVPGI